MNKDLRDNIICAFNYYLEDMILETEQWIPAETNIMWICLWKIEQYLRDEFWYNYKRENIKEELRSMKNKTDLIKTIVYYDNDDDDCLLEVYFYINKVTWLDRFIPRKDEEKPRNVNKNDLCNEIKECCKDFLFTFYIDYPKLYTWTHEVSIETLKDYTYLSEDEIKQWLQELENKWYVYSSENWYVLNRDKILWLNKTCFN